jgi:hypothetical protein|tara:strand:- start:9210 stop:10454 length:1245 start_codon:yes stop_codon:yes gene_type:complete
MIMKAHFNPRYLTVLFILGTGYLFAQQPELGYFRPNDKDGLNVFETSKQSDAVFDGLKVRVGGDFALQFQGISQTNSGDSLTTLGNNFNLPTANLNLDVQLADGMRMHLRTYLSSRNHTEAYVKGGYLQIDKLDFIKPGLLSGLMNVATLRFGMDEINYGDVHFRRSDNARAIFNPFVGNYIMDAFTTEPFAELTIQSSGFIGVLGATNGRLNQSVTSTDEGFVIFGKLGYDKQLNDDLRIRLTGSFYSSSDKSTRDYIYGGDRAGSRYYAVAEGSNFSGRYNPRFSYLTSFQINPFVKFQGFEFFGVYEVANNGDDATGGGFTQLGAEALYRFGADEQWYLGGRYNSVSGEVNDNASTVEISRVNVGAGWFLTKNVLTKIEYVNQKYDGSGFDGTLYQGGEFDGIVIEAAISF